MPSIWNQMRFHKKHSTVYALAKLVHPGLCLLRTSWDAWTYFLLFWPIGWTLKMQTGRHGPAWKGLSGEYIRWMDSASHSSPTTFRLEPLQPPSVDDGSPVVCSVGSRSEDADNLCKDQQRVQQARAHLGECWRLPRLDCAAAVSAGAAYSKLVWLENVRRCWTRIWVSHRFSISTEVFHFPPAGSAEILGELWGAEDLGWTSCPVMRPRSRTKRHAKMRWWQTSKK